MSDSNHALTHDFPEFYNRIRSLHIEDSDFRQQNERYHALDRQINALEARGVPIDDQTFVDMKMERANLKDALYQRLIER
ncbi:hypothetical protein GCM10011369_34360 [Neiella marina]|uniref:DUF465 domain-containing protein n=1 Tax=Neiella marina TaxID=508461 RepID=A0A8J2U9W2_9GAMM|nr:YdcH family protein [Neiella marina]GGA89313.1 hypothetical protein GCM10011369_34360 [Neiella marina]